MMLDYGSLDDDDEKPPRIHWPQALSILLLVIGAGFVVWSFVKPSLSSARAAWTQEHADAYQVTAIKLHGLAHEAIHATGSAKEREVKAELEKAQAEYDVLRTQLESAIARPNRIAWMLRIGGILLMAAGAGVLYRAPHREVRDA
jgi:hypothetical protein